MELTPSGSTEERGLIVPASEKTKFEVRMPLRHPFVPLLLILLASAALAGALSPIPLASPSASAPAAPPNLTLSFDAKPAYSEWWGIQPGYRCVNGSVNQSTPTKAPSAAFVRDNSRAASRREGIRHASS